MERAAGEEAARAAAAGGGLAALLAAGELPKTGILSLTQGERLGLVKLALKHLGSDPKNRLFRLLLKNFKQVCRKENDRSCLDV